MLVLGSVAVDNPQEAQPLLMTVALGTEADDFAIERIERGEQCGCSVALVIVRHRAGAARLQMQARLRAIQRLDLALLIATEHQRMFRRIEVKANNLLEFLSKLGIFAD